MLGPVVVLLLAVALFTARVFGLVPGSRPSATPDERPLPSAAPSPVRTFALIGVAGLTALAVAVVVVAAVGRPDRAEGLAVFGLFGYLVYLPAMVLLAGWLSRR